MQALNKTTSEIKLLVAVHHSIWNLAGFGEMNLKATLPNFLLLFPVASSNATMWLYLRRTQFTLAPR